MKKLQGLTILEVMLVLVLAGILLAASIAQYESMASDSDINQLQYSVDTVFLALGEYYQANCRQGYNSSGTAVPYTASLDPNNTTATTVAVLNSSQNLLGSFLLSPSWPPTPNGLIDSTAGSGGSNGYIGQFNLTTISSGSTPPSRSTPMGIYETWEKSGTGAAIESSPAFTSSQAVNVGTVYVWRAQVSVKLNATLAPLISTYQYRMNADCTSSLNGASVYPCSANQPGPYLVWERLPSMASPQASTSWWLTMPMVKSFSNQSTNDDMYGAYYPTYGSTTTGGQNAGNTYLCGG